MGGDAKIDNRGTIVKRIHKRATSTPHPTKVALLDVVKQLIAERGTDGFTVEMVLAESGISRGSLYHHFQDFPDLVEEALLEINRENVESSIELIRSEVSTARSKEEFLAAIQRVTSVLHSPERFKARIGRVRMLALCGDDERFKKRFGESQAVLIESLAEVIRWAQESGFAREDFDPKVLSTFVNAYTVGVILNDVSSDPVSFEEWNDLVAIVIERFVT